MSRFPRLKWAVAALLVAVAAILLTTLRVEPDCGNGAADLGSTDVAAEIEDQDDGLAIDTWPTDPAATVEGGSTRCLTLEQLENHPVLAQDAYRYDGVADSGPSISSYRGLSEQELYALTVQGDSAAMAVLGAMSIMRAREWPVQSAVPYLMLEDPDLMSFSYSRPLSAEFLEHMAEARRWFYKAALHGRVLVLYRVGESLSLDQGGPVELGWIDKAEYDGLSSYEKSALMPSNVYNVLAYEVAPELKSGILGEIFSEMMPSTDRQRVIVDELAEQFHRDLQDAGLPPIVVSESTAPPMEDLLSLLCESERDRLEKEFGNVR